MIVQGKESKRECPLCKKANTIIVNDEVVICLKCAYAWMLDDEDKTSWVCPTHRNRLRAYLQEKGKYEVRLWCDRCGTYYVVPDNLIRKVKRAFILKEEL